MLFALGDGRAQPAGRRAAEASVRPATGISHLRKLTAAGFLTVEAHGRRRYDRPAGPQVARLLDLG